MLESRQAQGACRRRREGQCGVASTGGRIPSESIANDPLTSSIVTPMVKAKVNVHAPKPIQSEHGHTERWRWKRGDGDG